ncbi:aspartyl/glutamyl-tRNA amidotransferase subunit C [Mycoplasma sp. Pen4]|uniref:Asp-tRNA(Asn)/Glu-tRNA(Gln) amidotransferase subunit GatC n=1 Tax=Mycoplasma sp. Pen4 TaxID=640330 RepID=UPI00165491AE|nr:Asp-tRNA(Asn)/Glu-tRNA(Gln) amidotransferase subunit GatC [Mycoplasma sp. Pen4]QNM93706.1 aspartyl/glutamyl-tRNA amidotransferase subunit C [Mycoplasma sp. Pen4]
MKNITQEKLKEICSSLMLEPTPEVLDKIVFYWNDIQNQLENLNKLDLANVKPMERMNETPIVNLLRDDEPDMSYSISKEQILSNAKDKDNDYIILTKVVK